MALHLFAKPLHILTIVPLILMAQLFLPTHEAVAQVCDNQALAFKGSTIANPSGDFIQLNPSPVSGNGNFTVEAWFYSTGGSGLFPNQFRRLFSLSGTGPTTRFEVGEDGTNLLFFWQNTAGGSALTVLPPSISGSTWYHLAVVRNGGSVEIFLNGVSIYLLPTGLGTLNTSLFRVGHWGFGPTPLEDWEGQVDEIRLWNTVRSVHDINNTKDCSLANPPGLLVNWTLNQGLTPGGPNPAATVAMDMSGNGNDGTLINFDLQNNIYPFPNSTSNFVCNTCPPVLSLEIKDLGSQSITLTSICSGTGAHFCILQNSTSPPGLSGATVVWEYFDQGISTQWTPVTTNPFPNNLCFGVQTLDLSAVCATSTAGFVDRKFRATVTKGSGNQTCSYLTSERLLTIYCPVTNASIAFAPPIPNPPNVALCEGTSYTTTVSLNSTDAFVPSGLPTNGHLGIQWCIDGVPVSPVNVASLPFTSTATAPDLCFEAKVSNGVCPLLSSKTCIPVDKVPMCGMIDVKPNPLVIMNDPGTGPYHPYDYLICPGNDAELMMLHPTDFKDCDAVWQIMFPNAQPGIWNDLNGFNNPTQNTGTLPQLSPTNPPSPWTWPVGETSIVYRIECRPKHYPFSDCAPCHSNPVQISLKQPKPAPVIAATQNPVCAPFSTTLTVSPYDPNCSYTWICNGEIVGNGPTYHTDKAACYWVEVFDGCFIQTSNILQLDVCEVVPVIECPQDNPCACLGVPITLTASIAYNNCGITGLIYDWIATSGTPLTGTGPQFVHNPDPNGTTYTLSVTDPNDPLCSWTSKTFTIKPCQ